MTVNIAINPNDDKPVYETTMRCKWLGDGAETIDQYIDLHEMRLEELKAMRDAGVVLGFETVNDDYARLITTDPEVAKRFGLELELMENEDE